MKDHHLNTNFNDGCIFEWRQIAFNLLADDIKLKRCSNKSIHQLTSKRLRGAFPFTETS